MILLGPVNVTLLCGFSSLKIELKMFYTPKYPGIQKLFQMWKK